MSELQLNFTVNDGGYSKTADQISSKTRKIVRDMQDLNKETTESVSRMQAASAAIRGFEGSMNTRAIEKFISQSEVLSNILLKAFPLVGGLALIEMLGRGVEKFAEFTKAATDSPAKIKSAFDTLNLSQQEANDKLAVTNDKLENQIAKLEGKPQNNLKLGLDEAKEAADRLAASLQNDITKINDIISKNPVSLMQSVTSGFFSSGSKHAGVADSTDTDTDISNRTKALKSLQEKMTEASFNGDTKLAASLKSQVDAAVNADIAHFGQQVQALTDQQNKKSIFKTQDQSGNIERYAGARQTLQERVIGQREQDRNVTDQKRLEQDQEAKHNKDAAAEAQKKANAALVEAQNELVASWKEAFRKLEALREQSAGSEVNFWAARVRTAQYGSISYKKALDLMYEAQAKVNKQDRQSLDSLNSIGEQMAAAQSKQAADQELWLQHQAALQQKYSDEVKAIQQKTTDAYNEQTIAIGEQTGTLSAHDAAMQMQIQHANEYQEALERLKAEQTAAASIGGDRGQTETFRIGQQIEELKGNRSIEARQDQQKVSDTAFGGNFNDMVKSFNDFPRNFAEVMKSTLSSINSDIVNGKGFKQTGADLAKSVSTMGLQKAEGNILGAFGLGGKPDGSSSKPLYTIDVTPGAGANGGGFGGGILGKLFGGSKSSDSSSSDSSGGGGVMDSLSSIIGGFGGNSDGSDSDSDNSSFGSMLGFANGGDIDPGMGSILVGENGPEIVQPRSAGTVIPNSKIGGLGGGDTHYHVDARGATDPAATAKMVQQAMMQTHKQSVSDSLKAQKETNLRKPPSARS